MAISQRHDGRRGQRRHLLGEDGNDDLDGAGCSDTMDAVQARHADQRRGNDTSPARRQRQHHELGRGATDVIDAGAGPTKSSAAPTTNRSRWRRDDIFAIDADTKTPARRALATTWSRAATGTTPLRRRRQRRDTGGEGLDTPTAAPTRQHRCGGGNDSLVGGAGDDTRRWRRQRHGGRATRARTSSVAQRRRPVHPSPRATPHHRRRARPDPGLAATDGLDFAAIGAATDGVNYIALTASSYDAAVVLANAQIGGQRLHGHPGRFGHGCVRRHRQQTLPQKTRWCWSAGPWRTSRANSALSRIEQLTRIGPTHRRGGPFSCGDVALATASEISWPSRVRAASGPTYDG